MPPVPSVSTRVVMLSLCSVVVPVLLKVMPAMPVAAFRLIVWAPLTLDWLNTTVSVESGITPMMPPVVALSDQFAPVYQVPEAVFQ